MDNLKISWEEKDEASNQPASSRREDVNLTGAYIGGDGHVGSLNILQDLKFGHVEKLVLSTVELSKLKRDAKNVEFELQDPIESFTGRMEILNDLHKKIQGGKEKGENITILSQTRVISGMGGVGKTQTIRKYIQMHKRQFYDHIIWINAENESTMRSSLRKLAETELRITCTNDQGNPYSDDDIRKIVYEILCQRRCLIVFDNAESLDETDGIKKFLPTTIKGSWKSPTVIVTSRWRKWEENVLHERVIQLEGLSEAEIWEFFSKYLNLDDTDENRGLSKKIGDLCEGLPIVLQQVWALIRTENDDREVTGGDSYTMRDFLSSYEEGEKRYLTLKPKDSSLSDSVYAIFCLTFSNLVKKESGPLALHYLRLMSVLSPSCIPRPLFLSLLDDSQKAGYIEPIKLLNNYNLISIPKSHLEVHRIIQEVTKEHINAAETVEDPLSTDKRTPLDKILTHIMDRLNVYLPKIKPNDVNKHACFRNAFCVALNSIHMLTGSCFSMFFVSLSKLAGGMYTREAYALLCKVVTEFKKRINATPDPGAFFARISPFMSTLQATQARYLQKMSKYNESLDLYQEVISVWENIPELRDDLLEVKAIIASILAELGKFDEAQQLYEYLINENLKDGDEEEVFSRRISLAVILTKRSRYEESFAILKPMVEELEAAGCSWEADNLHLQDAFANVLMQKGNYVEALKRFEKVVFHKGQLYGEYHPSTISSKNNLVKLLLNMSKFQDALKLSQEMEKELVELVDEDQDSLLFLKMNMAHALEELGQYKEALEMLEDVSVKWKKHGDNQPYYLVVVTQIASIEGTLGRYDSALTRLDYVIKSANAILGTDHTFTLESMIFKARLLIKFGKFSDAEVMLKEVLAISEKKYGKSYYIAVSAKANLGCILHGQGKYQEALALQKEVITFYDNATNLDDVAMLEAKADLATTLNSLGKFQEALDNYETIFPKLFKALGSSKTHKRVLCVKNSMAAALYNVGKITESISLYKEILRDCSEVSEVDPMFVAKVQRSLANILKRMGKYQEALTLQMELIRSREEALGLDHMATLEAKVELANTRNFLLRFQEALDTYETTLPKLLKTVGNSKTHKTVLAAKAGMADTLYNVRKITRSITFHKEIIHDCLEVGEVDPRFLIDVRDKLINTLKEMGNYEELGRLLEETMPLVERTFGALHPKSVEAKISLAEAIHFVKPNSSFQLDAESVAACYTCYGKHGPQTKEALHKLTSVIRSVKSIGSIDTCLAILEEKLEEDENGLNTDYWMLKMKIATGFTLAILGGKDLSCEISKSFSNSLRMFDRQMSQGSPTILKICKYAQLLRARIQCDKIVN